MWVEGTLAGAYTRWRHPLAPRATHNYLWHHAKHVWCSFVGVSKAYTWCVGTQEFSNKGIKNMTVKTIAALSVVIGTGLIGLVSCAGLKDANAAEAAYAGRFLIVAQCTNGGKPTAAQLAKAKACAHGWKPWGADAQGCVGLRPSNFTWMYTADVKDGTVQLRLHTPQGTTSGTAKIGEEGRNVVTIKCGG